MAVGVFDSGIGGLTVLDALQKRLPDVPFVYFGDNAHAPYGVRNADDIFKLTTAATMRLWDEGCDLVILACNTASAAALKRMQETWVPEGKRVLGVFVPLIEALTERQWGDNSPPREVAVKHVALFATPATVASRAFQRELAFRAIGVDVEAQPCGGVVDAIEAGDELLAEALVRSHVQALMRRMPHPQAAILGCTHYPFASEILQALCGQQVTMVETGAPVARRTRQVLEALPRPETQAVVVPGVTLLSTGDPEPLARAARRWLELDVAGQHLVC